MDVLRWAFVAWVLRAVVVLYGLWLATRLVGAVEKIADRMGRSAG